MGFGGLKFLAYTVLDVRDRKHTVEPLYCGYHWSKKCVPIREVSLFQRLICTQEYAIGTSEAVLIREVSSFLTATCMYVCMYV